MTDVSYYGHGGTGGDDTNDGFKGNNKYSGGKGYTPNNRNQMFNKNGNDQGGVVKASKAADHSKIFVGGLSWQTTEESLRWHFEQYGEVTSVEVMKDRNTGDPRGFAFVVFADPSTLDLVMADQDKHEINHKFVDVKRAQARGIAPPSIHENGTGASDVPIPVSTPSIALYTDGNHSSGFKKEGGYNNTHSSTKSSGGAELTPEQLQTKVFVGGIPPSVDRDELKVLFSQYGPVVDSIVMVDQITQRSRCFGFITFETGSGGAHKAIAAQPITIQGRNVEVKLATPRAEQPAGAPGSTSAQHVSSHTGGMPAMYNTSGGGNSMGTGTTKRTPAPGHLGLRAGKQSLTNNGEFAGLAVSYGRSGWKAGYGTKAFGKAGWAVVVRTMRTD
jgi:RNA-binding protein Musashi